MTTIMQIIAFVAIFAIAYDCGYKNGRIKK